MAIGLRKKKLIQSGLIGAGIMLLFSGTGGYFLYQHSEEREIALKQEYKQKMTELQIIAEQNNVGYALKEKVGKGTVITLDDVNKVYLPNGATAIDLINFDLEQSRSTLYARTDLEPNTVITSSLVYESEDITSDVREGEYAFIELPTNIAEEQYVDIRIQFPSGDDYIFLAKKRLKAVVGATVRLDLNEGEILTMSSAIVDAYVEGAKIYAIPYVDEHMQSASEVTYPVKENVKELITDSPNIVNFAKLNLEKQNRARLENNNASINETEKELKASGDSNVKSAQQNELEQMSAEERLNKLNEENLAKQQDLVGGSGQ